MASTHTATYLPCLPNHTIIATPYADRCAASQSHDSVSTQIAHLPTRAMKQSKTQNRRRTRRRKGINSQWLQYLSQLTSPHTTQPPNLLLIYLHLYAHPWQGPGASSTSLYAPTYFQPADALPDRHSAGTDSATWSYRCAGPLLISLRTGVQSGCPAGAVAAQLQLACQPHGRPPLLSPDAGDLHQSCFIACMPGDSS